MKKPLKVLSAAALASVFTATSLVPVAAAENPTVQADVTEFSVVKNEKIYQVSKAEYREALNELSAEGISVEQVTVFGTSTGENYKVSDFREALNEANGDVAAAVKMLSEDEVSLALNLPIVEATIDDNGKYVAKDEQPEDRLNETFFYNFAA